MKSLNKFAILLSSVLSVFSPLCADSATWTGGGGNNNANWTDNSNWGGTAYPNGATDNATFNTLINEPILNADISLNQLILAENSALLLTINGSSNTLTFSGTGSGSGSTGFKFQAGNPLRSIMLTPPIASPSGSNFLIQNEGNLNYTVYLLGESTFGTSGTGATPITIGTNAANPVQLTVQATISNAYSTAGTLTVQPGGTLNLGLSGSDVTKGYDVTVESGGTINGYGTIGVRQVNGTPVGGALTNSGTITPQFTTAGSTTSGYITTDNEITLTSSSILNNTISGSGNNSSPIYSTQIRADDNIAVDGTLNVIVNNGAYKTNDQFIPISNSGDLTGSFSTFSVDCPNNSSVTTSSFNPITYSRGSFPDGSQVSITWGENVVVPPLSASKMGVHAKAVHKAVEGSVDSLASDRATWSTLQNIYSQPDPALFQKNLVTTSSLAHIATPTCRSRNTTKTTDALNKKFYRNREPKVFSRKEKKSFDYPMFAIPLSGLFIEPIGILVHQETLGNLPFDGQIGFLSGTYGALAGATKVLNQKWVLEISSGYTHSNLAWRDFYGNAKWDSIYLTPFFGWFNTHAFANFMVMGVMNFHTNYRRISLPGSDLIAKSRHKSYDLVLRGNGGVRHHMGRGYWFQPDITLNWGVFFTNKYTESGAGGLSLHVNSATAYVLQPSLRGRFIKEYFTSKYCLAPCLYLGWLGNIPLGPLSNESRFRDAPSNMTFNIQGYTKMTNQLVVGAEFYAQRYNKMIIKTYFEADLLSGLQVYMARTKIEWVF